MKSWFVSDIHLKDLKERNGQTLLRFLFYLNQNPKQHRLFMLGDIFDMWLSDGDAFVQEYKALIEQIVLFKKKGGHVIYFEGNHDFHVDVFWTRRLNIPVIENQAYFHIDNKIVRLEHGDFINPNDKTYLRWRALVRHSFVEPLAHILPGSFWKWAGEKYANRNRNKVYRYTPENIAKVTKLIRNHALRVFTEKKFDLIVTGHMHVYDDFSFKDANKTIRSINLGTWLDKPRALLLEEDELQTIELETFLDEVKA